MLPDASIVVACLSERRDLGLVATPVLKPVRAPKAVAWTCFPDLVRPLDDGVTNRMLGREIDHDLALAKLLCPSRDTGNT